MSVSPPKVFIFDANFMICLKDTKSAGAYTRLLEVKNKIGISYATSSRVFKECPFLDGKTSSSFKAAVDIIEITENELNGIKNELKTRGVKLVAQDPDLTLIALAERMYRANKEVYIVSDDFKLSENVRMLQKYKIKFLSLPAFLQFVYQNVSGELKEYFGRVRKLVLKNNLDYMMSRHEQFPAQEKIVWLIENAVTVAGEGISITGACSEINPEDSNKYYQAMEDYIIDKPISAQFQDELKPIMPTLEKLKKIRKTIKDAKKFLENNEILDTLKQLQKSLSALRDLIQISGSELKKTEFEIVLRILASEYCKIDFLYAFVMIGQNKVREAVDALNETAMFATIAGLKDTVLSINYLKSLVYIFNTDYKRAIQQYNFTEELAANYKNSLLKLKCKLGRAITLYLNNEREDSKILMEEFAFEDDDKLSKKDMLTAMNEMGDLFYTLGLPEISFLLYSESLEFAVDLPEFSWMINIIIEKMKRTNIASAILGYVARPSQGLDAVIYNVYKVKNIDRFNEEMEKIAKFNQLFYEPFEYFTQVEKTSTSKGENASKATMGKKSTKSSKKTTKSSKKESQESPQDGVRPSSANIDITGLTPEELEVLGLIEQKQYVSPWTPYEKIHQALKTTFKVLKIQEHYETGHTLIIAYSEKLGLIAFDVALSTVLAGNAENYTIELKNTAEVKVERPSEVFKDMFLIRAIIYIKDGTQVSLNRTIPAFFSQMKI